MKKILVVPLAILLLVALILGSCAKPAPAPAPPTPAPAEKEWVPPVPGMKPGEEDLYFEYTHASSGTRTPPEPGYAKPYTELWYDEMEKATKGRFKVKYAYGGILGGARELPHLTGAGVCEISGMTGPEAADFTYLSMPTPGWFTMDLATNMKLAEILYRHPLSVEVLDRMNLVYIANVVYAPNYLQIRKEVKPIATVEDLKGLQLGAWSKVARLWAPEVGMVPVSLTSPFETYECMMKGMVDVVILSWTGHVRFNLYELTGQGIGTESGGSSPQISFMNKDAWNRLPQYIKDLWWKLYPTHYNDLYVQYELTTEKRGLAKAGEVGIKVFSLPEAEETKLVMATEPLWADWVNEMENYPGGKQVRQFFKDQIAARDKLTGEPWTVYTP